MSFYGDLQAGAKSTIDALASGSVHVTRVTSALPDPAASYDALPAETTQAWDANCVVTGVEAEYVDGDAVQADDLQIICSPFAFQGGALVNFEPKITDTFTIDGKVHRCVKIQRIPANGTAVCFMVFVKS